MFGGWCVRIGMVFALTTTEIEIFKNQISNKKKKTFMWGGAMLLKTSFLMRGDSLIVLKKCEAL